MSPEDFNRIVDAMRDGLSSTQRDLLKVCPMPANAVSLAWKRSVEQCMTDRVYRENALGFLHRVFSAVPAAQQESFYDALNRAVTRHVSPELAIIIDSFDSMQSKTHDPAAAATAVSSSAQDTQIRDLAVAVVSALLASPEVIPGDVAVSGYDGLACPMSFGETDPKARCAMLVTAVRYFTGNTLPFELSSDSDVESDIESDVEENCKRRRLSNSNSEKGVKASAVVCSEGFEDIDPELIAAQYLLTQEGEGTLSGSLETLLGERANSSTPFAASQSQQSVSQNGVSVLPENE